MKRFIINILLFVAPIIILACTIEILTGCVPNSYARKYDYIKNKGERIQVLAIGHSQLYDGFKPDEYYLPAFNCSNAAQTYMDDYYILQEILQYMPNLKTVIMPIGYLSVGLKGNDSGGVTDKCCYYHKYMNVDYDGEMPIKYRFECLDPIKACEKIYSYYFKHIDMVRCDSLGWRGSVLPENEIEIKHVGLSKVYTLNEGDYDRFCIKDEKYLIAAIELLVERDIKVVLVSPPYYWDYIDDFNKEQYRFLKDYVVELREKYPISYIDLEKDTTFTKDCFSDEAHLQYKGAKIFTEKLNCLSY